MKVPKRTLKNQEKETEDNNTIERKPSSGEESFLLMKFFPVSSHTARMLAAGNSIIFSYVRIFS